MKKMLITALIVTAFFVGLPTPASAQVPSAWGGVCVETYTDPQGNQYQVATLQGLQCFLGNIFQIFISLIGFMAFVMFIYGSFKYMLSGTNSKSAEDARKTLTYAIAGIILSLSAFIILRVIREFTGIEVTEFVVPSSQRGL